LTGGLLAGEPGNHLDQDTIVAFEYEVISIDPSPVLHLGLNWQQPRKSELIAFQSDPTNILAGVSKFAFVPTVWRQSRCQLIALIVSSLLPETSGKPLLE
jgi:hypothetical protein